MQVENRFHAFWLYIAHTKVIAVYRYKCMYVCMYICALAIIKTEPWGNADLTPKRSDTFWHWHISKGEKPLEICMRKIYEKCYNFEMNTLPLFLCHSLSLSLSLSVYVCVRGKGERISSSSTLWLLLWLSFGRTNRHHVCKWNAKQHLLKYTEQN